MELFWVKSIDNRIYGIAEIKERKPEQNGFLAQLTYTDGDKVYDSNGAVGLTYNWIVRDATDDEWQTVNYCYYRGLKTQVINYIKEKIE